MSDTTVEFHEDTLQLFRHVKRVSFFFITTIMGIIFGSIQRGWDVFEVLKTVALRSFLYGLLVAIIVVIAGLLGMLAVEAFKDCFPTATSDIEKWWAARKAARESRTKRKNDEV